MNTKIGVVGCGYWGKNLVRVFHELGALGTVCDVSPSVRESIRKTYPGVRVTSDVQDMVSANDLQAIVIAAPAVQHYALSKAALEHGKDVFVEKPLAMRVAEGQELVEIARRRDRILMVGHILEYHPAVRELQRLVREGATG